MAIKHAFFARGFLVGMASVVPQFIKCHASAAALSKKAEDKKKRERESDDRMADTCAASAIGNAGCCFLTSFS